MFNSGNSFLVVENDKKPRKQWSTVAASFCLLNQFSVFHHITHILLRIIRFFTFRFFFGNFSIPRLCIVTDGKRACINVIYSIFAIIVVTHNL